MIETIKIDVTKLCLMIGQKKKESAINYPV